MAWLFPGQASQFVGMGQDLVAEWKQAQELFDASRDVLGFDLPALCFDGPMEQLTETRNAQPAILMHSLAVASVLSAGLDRAPDFVAGHSLGEFSAAAAVGALAAEDALRVVRRRGELMFDAGQKVPGTMAAVMGLPLQEVSSICRSITGRGDAGRVVLANVNSAAQMVISGDVQAIEVAGEALKDGGARRVIPLPVSGAFHSPLMAVVQPEFAAFLEPLEMLDPRCPVVTNITAGPVAQAPRLKEGFVEQLVSPVRWHDSVAWMVEQGVDLFIEVGPGKVLTALGAKAFRGAEFHSTSTVEGVQKVLATLSGAQ
ncbi:[acyl-carrier-protein] S-malonyltransferase [bacterium]|nr:MAG: [acyl-carrier-protein] S-malonyltransferase [bacterium]RKZ18223.1 MAG: [acyl-carrier-protein] S-malonyltransferase [bacterium]